jgi:hypothetical protein
MIEEKIIRSLLCSNANIVINIYFSILSSKAHRNNKMNQLIIEHDLAAPNSF